MGSEAEEESTTPRLPLAMGTVLPKSPERSGGSGSVTPPLQSHSAAVPFRWEQQPGKPIHCTALVPFSNPKCLEPPPSRLLLPSPTTVLDGPYNNNNKRHFTPSASNLKLKRSGSFSSLSHPNSHRLWNKIYEGLKQAIPWRTSKKHKRQGSGLSL